MNMPVTKQDNLNRLYAQILKIDECGKDFLKKIITETAAKRVCRPRQRNFLVKPGSKRGLIPEWVIS